MWVSSKSTIKTALAHVRSDVIKKIIINRHSDVVLMVFYIYKKHIQSILSYKYNNISVGSGKTLVTEIQAAIGEFSIIIAY